MTGDLAAGTMLAGYRVESFIGRGGMGVVYLAEHVTLGRRVALKVVAPELVSDEAFRERFLREARLAASLYHPNIIPVYDAGDAGGVLFLAMRFVEGENLGDMIRREGRLADERTLDILSKVASALDEAHRNDLVHRDVKPDNVLLGASGSVFLTDFGLVRRLDAKTRLTRTGYMMGTLSYMAPEIFKSQEIDGRTDVYSLACVLFECLTGTPPYDREEQPAVITAHLLDQPPAVTSFRPELARTIDGVIARGMAKEREERQSSAGELIDDARLALADRVETVLARPPLPVPPPAIEQPSTQPPVKVPSEPEGGDGAASSTPTRTGDGPLPSPTRRWLPWVAAGAIALLAAGLIVPRIVGSDGGGKSGSSGATSTTGTTGTSERDPAVVLVASVDGVPATIDLDLGAAWVGSDDGSDGFVTRVQPGVATDRIEVGRGPSRLTFIGTEDAGTVWSANQLSDSVSRIDVPLSGALAFEIPVGPQPVRLLSPKGRPFVWAANSGGKTLTRIDSRSPSGDPRSVTVGPGPRAMAADPSSIWSANSRDASVSRVDQETLATERFDVGTLPSSILNVPPFVWVANTGDGTISVIDPSSGVMPPIAVGPEPMGLTNDGLGSIWVRNEGGSSVSRVDTDTFEPEPPIDLGARPVALAVTPSPGTVWAAMSDGSLVAIAVADETMRRFALGCTPVAMTTPPPDQVALFPLDLRGVWIACEDGSVLHVGADA